MDVARKLVILARESGASVELDDVEVESLVPAPLRNLPDADEFMHRLPEVRSHCRPDCKSKTPEQCANCLTSMSSFAGCPRCALRQREACQATSDAFLRWFALQSAHFGVVSARVVRAKAQRSIRCSQAVLWSHP
jgi:coenzyme F420-reducing hydrogenase gamma subunit